MKTQLRRFHAIAVGAGLAILAFSGLAFADPPSRVARIGYMTGAVSFSPAGEEDWLQATINRPLTTGDRVWADAGSRAEIQVGGATLRMSATTEVSILNLDDQIAQMQLTQGALNVRVRGLAPGQTIEVDTPNLAFTVRQPGAYRIEVDPDGNATTIIVRSGQGEVYGEGAAYVVDESPSGGLHVHVPLAEPAGFDEVARVMTAAKALFASLDRAPMSNRATGCIRPPGAAHRLGGSQRLVTDFGAARRVFLRRNRSPRSERPGRRPARCD